MKLTKILCTLCALMLTLGIALAGIFFNSRYPLLDSGGQITPALAQQGVALTHWTQDTPGEWCFQLETDPALDALPDDGKLLLCLSNGALPAPENPLPDAAFDPTGEFYSLPVLPGESFQLKVCSRQMPQAWIMAAGRIGTWLSARTLLQLLTMTSFATMAFALLALYHYKKRPELRYFLIYLAVLICWGGLVICFPAARTQLLNSVMRLFFAVMILASSLLAAALLELSLPLPYVVPGSVLFLMLSLIPQPLLRFDVLTAGLCLCLYILIAAVWHGYEAAGLLLFSCAVTTGLRVLALFPCLRAPFYVESLPFYLLRCARIYDIPFALGCMTFVCRRFALQFDRTEQLAQELDARVMERTHALTEETEARKSMMLNIFHDLRSPLFAVSSGLDTLVDAPEALPALLPALQQRIAFVRRLTEDLFLAAKLEQKQVLLNEDRVLLNETASSVCIACQSEALKKGVVLSCSATCPLPVWGDETRLEQIVQNLITNAIHYTPTGGSITVTGFVQDCSACVSVRDTGCGIAPEDQDAVFDRYFHTTANTKHDSTGLGLTIAQELARLHHGEILLMSELGKGSCFTLKLPLLE